VLAGDRVEACLFISGPPRRIERSGITAEDVTSQAAAAPSGASDYRAQIIGAIAAASSRAGIPVPTARLGSTVNRCHDRHRR
jgi:hypothetical protein